MAGGHIALLVLGCILVISAFVLSLFARSDRECDRYLTSVVALVMLGAGLALMLWLALTRG